MTGTACRPIPATSLPQSLRCLCSRLSQSPHTMIREDNAVNAPVSYCSLCDLVLPDATYTLALDLHHRMGRIHPCLGSPSSYGKKLFPTMLIFVLSKSREQNPRNFYLIDTISLGYALAVWLSTCRCRHGPFRTVSSSARDIAPRGLHFVI